MKHNRCFVIFYGEKFIQLIPSKAKKKDKLAKQNDRM